MSLSLVSLTKATDALARSINVLSRADVAQFDVELMETIEAGVIQHFEVAYELSWKMIQRWVKDNVAGDEFSMPRTRKDLFRVAARYGLVDDPLPWFGYGESRNKTAHTYDQDKASEVLAVAKRFLPDALFLLGQLEQLND